MGNLITALVTLLSGLPKLWAIFLLAMFPVIELRGAIPLAVAWDLPLLTSFVVAVLGNMAPVLPLLYFLGPVSRWLEKHFLIFRRFFQWVFNRSRRHEHQIEKYGYWGLVVFVAIPVPGTGVWVGSALAFLLGLKVLPSFLAMTLGVVIAGSIMTFLSLGVAQLIVSQGLIWTIFLILTLIALVLWLKNKQQKK